jgi:tetratricopeptide (TPR) repeat protein
MDAPASGDGPEFNVHIEQGIAARARGAWTEAAQHFRDAVALRPSNLGARGELAFTLLSSGALEEAREACRSILLDDARNANALAMLGNISRRQGDQLAALEYFEQAVASDPANLALKSEMANSLRQLERYDEAAEALFANLAVDPLHGPSLIALGLVKRRRQENSAAAFFLQLAARYDAANLDLHCEVARTLVDLGRLEGAEAAYREVLERDARHPPALRGLAQIARRQGRWDEAVQRLSAAAQAAPADVGIRIELSAAYRAMGRPDDARTALTEALSVAPDDYDAALGLAELAVLGGELATGLRLCDALIAQHPSRVRPIVLKSVALIQAGRPREAAEFIRSLDLVVPPSDEWDAARLGILRFCGDRSEVEVLLGATEERAGQSFDLWSERVATLTRLGEFALVEQAMAAAPATSDFQRARASYLAGVNEDRRWRLTDAIAAFEKAVDLHADFPEAHHDLARLYFLMMEPERSARHLRIHLDQDASGRRMRGQSLTLTQTLLGQLLNELNLDPGLRTRLEETKDLPARQRVERLIEIVRGASGLTPPAIFLLLALRQSGALDRPISGADLEKPPIPAAIVLYLGGRRAAPDLEEGWRARHPDWRFAAFGEREAIAYLQANCPSEVLDAYRRSRGSEQAGHVFSLAYLLNEGGFLVGPNLRCVGPLGAVVDPSVEFVVGQDVLANLTSDFLACAPQDPVIARALQLAITALSRNDQDIPWLSTGPGLITRALAQVLAEAGEGWPTWLDRRQILGPADLDTVFAVDETPAPGPRMVRAEGGVTSED